MKSLVILKIGGNVVDAPSVLNSVLRDFSTWQYHSILVHGGGKIAGKLMERLGIAPQMVEGRRITDRETLDIVTMVYAGLINKNIVAALQNCSCNAIGLTGADANIIPAKKRPIKEVDYGFVGDVKPENIPTDTIVSFLNAGLVPVIAPITHNCKGALLNTNADTIASSMAIALAKKFRVKLIFCFEKKGVLSNPDDENSVIESLNEVTYWKYKTEGIITTGMIPKLDNAFAALRSGVSELYICNPNGLKTDCREGTLITLNSHDE